MLDVDGMNCFTDTTFELTGPNLNMNLFKNRVFVNFGNTLHTDFETGPVGRSECAALRKSSLTASKITGRAPRLTTGHSHNHLEKVDTGSRPFKQVGTKNSAKQN